MPNITLRWMRSDERSVDAARRRLLAGIAPKVRGVVIEAIQKATGRDHLLREVQLEVAPFEQKPARPDMVAVEVTYDISSTSTLPWLAEALLFSEVATPLIRLLSPMSSVASQAGVASVRLDFNMDSSAARLTLRRVS